MHLFTNWTDSSTFFLAPPLSKENIKKPLKKVNSSKREEKKVINPKHSPRSTTKRKEEEGTKEKQSK